MVGYFDLNNGSSFCLGICFWFALLNLCAHRDGESTNVRAQCLANNAHYFRHVKYGYIRAQRTKVAGFSQPDSL